MLNVMTATGHAITGTVLAAIIPNPFIGIPVAILSHIACDAFPHWDTGTNMRKYPRRQFIIGSFVDLGISLIVPFFLITSLFPQTDLFYTYTMVISAQGMDWISAPYNFLRWNFPPFNTMHKFQKLFDNRLDKPWGIIAQVWVLLLLIAYAKLI